MNSFPSSTPVFAPGSVWGYVRKSTKEEGAGRSLDDQEDCIMDTCETWGLPMTRDCLARENAGMSGKLWWAGGGGSGISGDHQEKGFRPVLTRLVEGIVSGQVRAIVVWSQDRLWRHVGICEAMIELMARHSTCLFDRNGSVDISTPEGRSAVRATAAAAQYARERAAVDAPRGVRSARKKGKVVVNAHRLGFRSVGKATGLVQHIPEEQALVVEIFRMFVQGSPEHGAHSVHEIAGILTKRNLPWLTDVYRRRTNIGEENTIIYATTLYSVLRDPRYQGRQPHGGQEWDAPAFLKPDGSPVVPVWLFEAAQAKLDGKMQVRGTKKTSYGLSGLIRCGLCGQSLVMNGTTVKDADAPIRRVPAWVTKHRSRTDGVICPHKLPMLHKAEVDEYVNTHLAHELIAELQERDHADGRLALTNEKAGIQRDLAAAESEKSTVLPGYFGKVSPDLLGKMELELNENIAGLKQRLRSLERQMNQDDLSESIKMLPELPEPARRDILRGILCWVAVLPSGLPNCLQKYPDEKVGVRRPHPDRGRLIFLTKWGSLHTACIHRGRAEKGVYPICKLRPAPLEEAVGTVSDLPDVEAFLEGLERSFKGCRRDFNRVEMAPGRAQKAGQDENTPPSMPTFNL